jgi:hypothetical protein
MVTLVKALPKKTSDALLNTKGSTMIARLSCVTTDLDIITLKQGDI